MKWLLLTGSIIAAVSLLSWKFLSADARTVDSSVPTAAPAAAIASLEIQGIGYVEPVSEIRRLMLRTGGVIKRTRVDAGAVVRKGDVLLELDDLTQRACLELARKQLEQARADAADVNAGVNPYRIKVLENTLGRLREKVRHATADVKRYDQLVGEGGVSKQDHDLALTRLTQAEMELREQEAELLHLRHFVTPEKKVLMAAKIEHAAANLRLAEERLQETRVTAPCDGTVLKILKREGEGVSTLIPEAVMLFGDLSRLRVRAEIDERFVSHLKLGQEAVIFGRNLGGRSYQGKVVLLEKIMGDKTVFTRASSERKDLNVLQVVIDMDASFTAPAGLQVDVKIHD